MILGLATTRRDLAVALVEVDRSAASVRHALQLDAGVRFSCFLVLNTEPRHIRGVVERWRMDEPLTWEDVEDALMQPSAEPGSQQG